MSVKLNRIELNALSVVPAGVREQARRDLLQTKQDKLDAKNTAFRSLTEKWSAYKNAPMEFSVTEAGFVVIKHTGTRRDAILSPDKARTLVKNFNEFKALVLSLPEGK